MQKQDRIIRGTVSAQPTSSRTSWKCASEIEFSETQSGLNKCTYFLGMRVGIIKAQSVFIQQVDALAGSAQARWKHQRRSNCPINKFTYFLEITSKIEVSETQSGSSSELTYSLETHKRNRTIRRTVSVQ